MAAIQDQNRFGQIRATARLPEIDMYIKKVHGEFRALTPKEDLVITQEVNAQMRVIRRNWPVDTGTSRAGWTYYVQPNPGVLAVIFENFVPYSAWVTKKGQVPVREGGRPWYQKLLQEVWKANKPRLYRRLKEQIDRTEAEYREKLAQEQNPAVALQRTGRGTIPTISALQRRQDAARNVISLMRRIL
tara:strand:- start:8077 stop:8640 length:564 start_codon:yes stop_codon:yes gene_type:complete